MRSHRGTLPWWRELVFAAVVLCVASVLDVIGQLVIYGRVHW